MVTAKPLISIVMPVFNGESFLAEAIESVLAQSYQNFELIVVDDGSTDLSAHIVQSFRAQSTKIQLLKQVNQGVTAARNRGILAGTGSYVAFLDQDDVWMPTALHYHLEANDEDPNLGYTLSHLECFLAENCQLPAWFGIQSVGVPQVGYMPGTLMAKRVVFDELGLFEQQYTVSSDADWFARAHDSKVKIGIVSQVTLRRRIHHQNQSANSALIQGELFRLLCESIKRKRKLNE